MKGVDEQLQNAGAYEGRDRQIGDLLERAEVNVREQTLSPAGDNRFWGTADPPGRSVNDQLREGVAAAARALEELLPLIEPADVRSQVTAVHALLESLA